MSRKKDVMEVPATEPAVELIDSPLVDELSVEPKPDSVSTEELPAKRDLEILIQAAEIRRDSRRFTAARAIAGSAVIL